MTRERMQTVKWLLLFSKQLAASPLAISVHQVLWEMLRFAFDSSYTLYQPGYSPPVPQPTVHRGVICLASSPASFDSHCKTSNWQKWRRELLAQAWRARLEANPSENTQIMLLSRLLPIAERQDMNTEVQHDSCIFPGQRWYPRISNSVEGTCNYLILGLVLKMTKA